MLARWAGGLADVPVPVDADDIDLGLACGQVAPAIAVPHLHLTPMGGIALDQLLVPHPLGSPLREGRPGGLGLR